MISTARSGILTRNHINRDMKWRNRNVLLVQACHLSTLESMYNKFISSPHVHYVEDSMAHFHDMSGIPWFGTIILSTAAFRILLALPAQVTSQKVAAKRFLLQKEMDETLIPSLKKASHKHVVLGNYTKERAKELFEHRSKQIYSEKIIEYNCHHSKLFLPLFIQLPFWLTMSSAIRNLAMMRETSLRFQQVPVEDRFYQLSTEGALWFPNLTVADASYILPVIVGLSFALNIFIHANRSQVFDSKNKYQRGLQYVGYLFSFGMIPLASYQPTALIVYWATSGVIAIVMNLIMFSPKFRSIVRIPTLPTDSN